MEHVLIYARINKDGKADWDTCGDIKDNPAAVLRLAIQFLPAMYEGVEIKTIDDSELTPNRAKQILVEGINEGDYSHKTILAGYMECEGLNNVNVIKRVIYMTNVGLKKDSVWE